MASPAVLKLDVVADVRDAIKSVDQLSDHVKDRVSGLGKIGAAGLGVAAGITAELTLATKAAVDDAAQTAKLAQTYKNLGLAQADVAKATDAIDAASRRNGQSSDASTDAYNKLVMATSSTTQAMADLTLAQDLAAATGTDVAAASDLLIKAHQGQYRGLKALGVATEDGKGAALSYAQVTANLTEKVKGQADAFGDTAAGKMARYRESIDQAQEKIGGVLLPVLGQLLDILQPLFGWLDKNEGVLRTLVPIAAAVAGVIYAIVIAVKVWTAVQTVLNFVLTANPIGIIIVAIGALIAAVVLAYQHFDGFRKIVDSVFDVLAILGRWILDNWRIIVGAMLGPLGLIILNFDRISAAIHGMIDWLQRLIDKVTGPFRAVGGFLANLNPFSTSSSTSFATATVPFSARGQTPVVVQVYAQPGDNLPEVVYDALRHFQRRHHLPALAATFGP